MIEHRWTDPDRPERFTVDTEDRRSIAARIWYPAENDDGPGAPYVPDAVELEEEGDLAALLELRSHAVAGAVALPGPFPVVLYNHGANEARFTSSFVTEELASHGYVVVSVGHDGLNRKDFLLGGSSVVPDTLTSPEPSGDPLADRQRMLRYVEEIQLPEWLADARFALDRVAESNSEGRLAGSMDLQRIGALGWSFGGSVSIELSVIDDRIVAAVDHDGTPFGTAPRVGTDRPFLLVRAGWTPNAPPSQDPAIGEASARAREEAMAEARARYAALKASSTSDWYDVTIAGAGHASFSDHVIVHPGWAPEIEPARGHAIINALTVAFFDRYLAGRPSPLLEDPTGRFPEVMFERRVER